MSQVEKRFYSRDLKRQAVKRMEAGESSSSLSSELGVKRTKLYLAVVLDAFSRKVVGWALEN